jgi:hypothetical protein
MKKLGAMDLSKPPGMKASGRIATPKPPKLHPAAQQARIRLPEGDQTPSDPAPFLPTVGKV